MQMTPHERTDLMAKVSRVFSPSAPINSRDLFAGRIDQLQRVFDAVGTRGQHAVIFGERGVGKTSLSNIIQEISTNSFAGRIDAHVAKVNTSENDDFHSIWKKLLGEIPVILDPHLGTFSFASTPIVESHPACEFLPDKPSPNDIRKLASSLGTTILIFDEFDRLASGHGLFADTIKTLSDSSTDCTLVLVGVASDIDTLISEHASVDRALIQILMPRMTRAELNEIIDKAMEALGMKMDQEAQSLIVLLSQGLPHYTHVLGKSATNNALRQSRWNVTINDVNLSINSAIESTQQKIQAAYQRATASPRKDTLFKQVLLACALAEVDDLGYFASTDAKGPLSAIMNASYEVSAYSAHLNKFCHDDRGRVLEKSGTLRRFRFRFANPLLQPFVIMRGIADGMLAGDWMKLLEKKAG